MYNIKRVLVRVHNCFAVQISSLHFKHTVECLTRGHLFPSTLVYVSTTHI